MQQLTHGDRNMPMVAMGWNSERYQGRNLALRLVALGYTNVYWYRGGREAWEVAGLRRPNLLNAGLVGSPPRFRGRDLKTATDVSKVPWLAQAPSSQAPGRPA